MNDQQKRAREWAEQVMSVPEAYNEIEIDAARHILATTDALTMSETKWDADAHFLAGATTEEGDEFVMLSTRGENGILTARPGDSREDLEFRSSDLTLNGKKYGLHEITEPGQPETLETEDDYKNAPSGTVVAADGGLPYVKRGGLWHEAGASYTDKDMTYVRKTRLLRKGWEG